MAEVTQDQLAQQDLHLLLANVDLSSLNNCSLFVTGCTGFIGYWLLLAIDCLNQRGADIEVTAVSRSSERFFAHYPLFSKAAWLTLIDSDIADLELVQQRFDYLIHGATDTRPERLSDAKSLVNAAQEGTRRVCEQARHSAIKAMLLISSGAAAETVGSASTLSPNEAYIFAKQQMEDIAATAAKEAGFELKIARCYAFIGLHLPPHLAISQFIEDALNGRDIVVKGDGRAIRSYLYAADLAVWLLRLLLQGKNFYPYQVGSDRAIDIKGHAELVVASLCPDKSVKVLNPISGEDDPRQRYVPDIRQACQDLEVGVWTDEETAIRQTARMRSAPNK
jgi:dTDP-glucose 4,6-dehydratase